MAFGNIAGRRSKLRHRAKRASSPFIPPTVDIRGDEGTILPFSRNLFPIPCPAERRKSHVFRMPAKKLIKSEGTVTSKPEWAGSIAESFFPGPFDDPRLSSGYAGFALSGIPNRDAPVSNDGTDAPPQRYSITSSARASTGAEISTPSAFAVLRLMNNSNLVGCSTGRSAGLAPLRILSTYLPLNRKESVMSAP
jgi:hypothetical protein